jgi:hypothetical protein
MEEPMNSSVALVLDRNFKEPIDDLARKMPVWIISSGENDLAVARARGQLKDPSRVTSIFAVSGENEGEMLGRALYDIDEHHGAVSADRPYSQIMIYGVAPELIAPELMKELGLEVADRQPGGFSLRRHSVST